MNAIDYHRPLFSRFHNLNLLVLRDDLRNGNFCMARWCAYLNGGTVLCPMAHGWTRRTSLREDSLDVVQFTSRCLGATVAEVAGFISWWDTQTGLNYSHATKTLIGLIESIIAERQNDADTMQEILKPKENTHAPTRVHAVCR